jgi:glycerol-3-phosphate acyltransferase PlsY
MEIIIFVAISLGAYFLGSISFAVVFAKLFDLKDPRTTGSNNPGATNMLRVGGSKVAMLTFACDALKGYMPMIIAKVLGFDMLDLSIVGLMSFLGHLYPVYYGFSGGKGVATSFGLTFGFSHFMGAMMFLTWLGVYYKYRIVSLASMVSTCILPFICMALFGFLPSICFIILSLLVVFAHRINISMLLAGNEEKTEFLSSQGA